MEEFDPSLSHSANMIAGAAAGVMEHIAMYPVDTIKTRLQTVHISSQTNKYTGFSRAMVHVIQKEGIAPLFRGVGAAALGAAPAHALYFAAYEWTKSEIGEKLPLPVATSLSGVVATIVSDVVMTPWDVVKQRLQIENTPYKGIVDCVKTTIKTEGIGAFFISYPATVMMNIPFVAAHFTTYELTQPVVSSLMKEDMNESDSPVSHLVAGGMAGAAAAAVSNPLDVAKTRLQTQIGDSKRYHGLWQTISLIVREEGSVALLKGISARMLFHIPSAAVCWATYGTLKQFLTQ